MSSRPPRARRSSLAWAALIIAVLVALGGLAAVSLLKGGANGTEGSLVGQPAPRISALDLSGARWTPADGAGKVTWINFWSTSCSPCRTEMPAMQRLSEVYAGGLLIMGVDWGEERSAVASFAARYAVRYPI